MNAHCYILYNVSSQKRGKKKKKKIRETIGEDNLTLEVEIAGMWL